MTMKLHFEPNLDYQLQAIEAVADLFRGQEICRTEFTVTRDALNPQGQLGLTDDELGRSPVPSAQCARRGRHRCRGVVDTVGVEP